MDRLSEIRARFEEAKADNARGYMIHTADVEYLLAEIERLNDELYDADGVNLVKYWHQQCQIQENSLHNYGKVCAVYKDRAKKAKAERDELKQILDMYGGEEEITTALKEWDEYKAEAANRWITVGERLPEDDKPVLAFGHTVHGTNAANTPRAATVQAVPKIEIIFSGSTAQLARALNPIMKMSNSMIGPNLVEGTV